MACCGLQIRLLTSEGAVWEFCTARTAAIATLAGTPVRLKDVPDRNKIRVTRWGKYCVRPVTDRRIAAAAKALQNEQAAAPLFAEKIASDQPTPQARIASKDSESQALAQKVRKERAATWKRARELLGRLEPWQREMAIVIFNGWFSHDPTALVRMAERVASEYPSPVPVSVPFLPKQEP